MKKYFFISLIFVLAGFAASAQDTIPHYELPREKKDRPPLRDRLLFGGDLGLQFGDVTYINIAPTVAYKITERFAAGLGPSYSYLKYRDYPSSFNSYGGRVFSQYRLLENIMAYSEFGLIKTDAYDIINDKVVNITLPSFLVGGAYIQELGGNSTFNILLLYNLLEDQYSYYQNPIIRVGFNIGM